ncbi:L,D-transpeptidase [Aureimonas ureilytica]|uniref:L,D-transpeptidase n=1 Tax=Aureimonas ureilytica TaxID=401562 RepID=UPI003CEDF057
MTLSSSGPRARLSRRAFLVGGSTLFLGGCVTAQTPAPALLPSVPAPPPPLPAAVPLMYRAAEGEPFEVAAVDPTKIPERYWRREVPFVTSEAPGTVIVDTQAKHLYHVRPGGTAMRYGIGVGREGFSWEGRAVIAYKRRWPRWTPPDSMVARQPELRPYSIANGGMDPGPRNPLGARALYIHQNGADTLYRLHGTFQPWSIGKAVSSGCIRLLNQDVIHLFDEVRDGSPIVVHQTGLPDAVAV